MLYLTHAYFKIKLSVGHKNNQFQSQSDKYVCDMRSVGHKNVVKENKVRKQREKEIHAAPLSLLHLYHCCTSITAFAVFVRFFIGIVMT